MKLKTHIQQFINRLLIVSFIILLCSSCQENEESIAQEDLETEVEEEVEVEETIDPTYILPDIDLNNWKVTLPIGAPDEIEPPKILTYATNETLKPFFYNDSINGALVFYTYPGSSTANSSYSRTELREQMIPGSNSTNWTFKQGGRLKGTLSVSNVSKKSDGDYDKIIIMQIHGRLTNEQRDLIGQKDNNAPPMLKIYWQDNIIRVKTKTLNDPNADSLQILETTSWGNDDGYNFPVEVGFDKFTIEIIATEGRMEVILNETMSKVYDSEHIIKWGVFENYFKAGNYLGSTDNTAFSTVKYYDLTITH
ncbi:polysaccharide lyase family 7 protein [Flavicella sp.]|uniref:polysaccharide lyase family 7 protein n=1 Tax=Flavicella sp. TaxID=2957742 RepID=UPI003019BFE3